MFMAKIKQRLRKASAVLLSSLLTVSAMSAASVLSVSAVSYSEMSALDQYAYSGNDLGAVYTRSSTTFKVWAPTASSVKLKRYKTGSDSESGAGVIETKDMTKQSQGVWSATVSGDIAGTYYTYLVTCNGVTKETNDIYAKATGVNGMRGMVIDLDSTDPSGWDNDQRVPCTNQTDAVIWEAHVRDFSASSDSGMTNKGKYLAFTETGTTVNNDGIHPTGVDYLENLGVTHIHLLPVYDYGSVDETKLSTDQFNWGYDPMNYNTPEGSYSTDPYHGEVRVREFKQMVQSLHNKGIGVVMDVVYNHTYAGDSNINDWFNYTVPNYYYRQNSKGTFSNASGCGNETASDRAMYQKFMIDSLKYWATEYHLDGFRFDLMGIHDTDTMNLIRQELDKIDPDILIYGEPWTAEASPCPKTTAVQGNMKLCDTQIAAFNDQVRDAIKGSCFDKTSKGFIQGAGYEEQLKGGILANVIGSDFGGTKWSRQPSQTVTYTSAHDNYTLYDKLVTSCGGSYGQRRDDLVQMNKMAGGIILTSQGMSFWQAGEEFARSKGGDENSYKSPTSVNQLCWSNTKTYSDLVNYYKGLIEIRKAYTPFRDPTKTSSGTIYFSWGTGCPANVVAFTMYNKLTKDSEWDYVAVLHNANSTAKQVTLMTFDDKVLPSQWVIVADGSTAGLTSLGTTGSIVTVPARSTMVLVDKTSFDNTVISKKGTVTVNHVLNSTGETYKTETLTGKEGTSYSTSPLSALTSNGYKVANVTGSTSGTFSKTPVTITYYYDFDSTNYGTVTVKYTDKDTGAEITSSETHSGKIGTSYSFTAKDIDGYLTPKEIKTGTYSAQSAELVFEYAKAPVTGMKIHYYNSNSWSQVAMYVYTGSGNSATLLSGAWPGTLMTNDGNGWYSGFVKDITSASFIANDNGISSQDPSGYNTPGYTVTGSEVWVKNGQVYPSGTVNVNYISTDGKLLGSETLTGIADGTNRYTTSAKTFTGYTLSESPSNASGLYTSSAITVTYKYTPDVSELVNNSSISSDTVTLGDSITVNCSASGGTSPYTYTVNYKKSSGSNWSALSVSGNTAVLKPGSAVPYDIKVTASDASGSKAEEQFTVTVNAPVNELKNNSTLSAESITIGESVTLKGAASGGKSPYKYAFYYKKASKTSWSTLGTAFGSNTSAVLKPGAAVPYDIKIAVKDSSGTKVNKTFTLDVRSNSGGALVNNSSLSSESVKVGTKVTLKGAASGGTSPYLYAFYYKKSTNSTWSTLGTLYGTENTATLTPSKAVDYDIRIVVMDDTGTIKEKLFVLNVSNSTALVNRSTVDIGGQHYDNSAVIQSTPGTKVGMTGAAAGGSGSYKYAFMYKKHSASTWTKIGEKYGSAVSASFTPKSTVLYDIMINAKDSSGTVKSKTFSLQISNAVSGTKLTLSSTSVKAGTKVKISAQSNIGKSPYKYAFYYKKNSSSTWTKLGEEFGTADSVYLTPKTATTYNIKVVVMDADYSTTEDSANLTVT